jgi:SNF2 family DNA or RNA helicase
VLQQPVTIPAPAVSNFLLQEAPTLASYFSCEGIEIPTRPERSQNEIAPPPMPNLKLEGSLNYLSAKFQSGGSAPAIQRLRSAGFAAPDSKAEMVLKGEREILSLFATILPRLEREWRVEIGERFQHVTRDVERLEPRLEVRSSGEQWFDLAYDMQTSGGEKFSAADIARLLQTGQSHVKRPGGKVVVFDPALLDDFSNLLSESNPEQRSPGLFRLQKRQAGALQSFAEETGLNFGGDAAWKQWSGSQQSMQPVALGSLEDTLRPYQKQGVSWFDFIAKNGFGGILADEMGLGKTLQALAFLRTLKGSGPSLIVCPSSLIFNWTAEAARWVPDLKVLILEGPRRGDEFGKIASSNLVITSYPLLRVDVDRHRLHHYAAVVLDEAQQIKNPDSQNAKAATALHAKHRFALTGTPVENSVRDLWSLMHFLMPGYLGKRTDFKERYENPISKQSGGPEQQRLSRRVSPFLLRRTKQLVAKELPEKLEQIAWCELTTSQREIYTKLAESTRKQISELSSGPDQKKSRMVMLTALLRLRQASCDARLLGMESPPDDIDASAKLDLLMELLEEAIDGGHRVLVFSQFVTMLGLIRARLEAAEMSYCYLDGQSRDRAAQVQKFQLGQTSIFLISLKAGGTGLNLTAADTVMHFDPWWNPAVEAQATDRAHRIGQKNVVTSYKLIARGTVEEKILNLQEKKKSIIAATLESEQPMMDGLTLAEIQDLLS